MTATLNLREMLLGHLQRLRHVIRFGTCYRVHNESVAEHSFYTALYAQLMGRALGPSVDTGLLVQCALLHDVEEARTGDFPRPLKYSSKEAKQALQDLGHLGFRQCFSKMVSGTTYQDLYHQWSAGKNESTTEGRILTFADYLSVLSYVWSEVRGSNITMREHLDEMYRYHALFSGVEYDCVRPWVDEAGAILREIMYD